MIEAIEATTAALAGAGTLFFLLAILPPTASDLLSDLLDNPRLGEWYANSKAWEKAFAAFLLAGMALMMAALAASCAWCIMEEIGNA